MPPTIRTLQHGSPPSKLRPVSPPIDVSTRRVIVICFWTVVLLGVPIWWHTTTIERLPLPRSAVEEWVAKAPCFLRPSVELSVRAGDGRTVHSVEGVAKAVRAGVAGLPAAQCLDVQIAGGSEETGRNGSYDVVLEAEGETRLGSGRTAHVRDDGALNHDVLNAVSSMLDLGSAEADPRVVKFAGNYKLVFSLLNEDSASGGALFEWEIQSLLERHLGPLLSSLAPLHTFTIETQIQYFAPLSINVQKTEDGTVIEEEDLRAFVNPADWNMASSVTLDPVLHFILFVPSVANRPMRIQTASGSLESANAFITPQWGGVVIFNPTSLPSPPSELPSPPPPLSLPSSDLTPSFLLFEQQLQKLLGVPLSPASTHRGSLSAWQVDAMLRRRLGEAAREGVETLRAIVDLVRDIPNMRVGAEVQNGVRNALEELAAARAALARSLEESLGHAAAAQRLASKAYYNPTMLALLYFPDEHKAAVYTPLFGPVAIPLIVALFREFKEWKERRRKAKEAAAGKEKTE